jgi:hypothetical protein
MFGFGIRRRCLARSQRASVLIRVGFYVWIWHDDSARGGCLGAQQALESLAFSCVRTSMANVSRSQSRKFECGMNVHV